MDTASNRPLARLGEHILIGATHGEECGIGPSCHAWIAPRELMGLARGRTPLAASDIFQQSRFPCTHGPLPSHTPCP